MTLEFLCLGLVCMVVMLMVLTWHLIKELNAVSDHLEDIIEDIGTDMVMVETKTSRVCEKLRSMYDRFRWH